MQNVETGIPPRIPVPPIWFPDDDEFHFALDIIGLIVTVVVTVALRQWLERRRDNL